MRKEELNCTVENKEENEKGHSFHCVFIPLCVKILTEQEKFSEP